MASTQSHSSTQKLTPKPAVFVTMDFDITTNEPNPVELVAMNCRNLTSETFELKNESQWRLAIHFINRELILEQRRSENYYPTAVTVSSLEKSILTVSLFSMSCRLFPTRWKKPISFKIIFFVSSSGEKCSGENFPGVFWKKLSETDIRRRNERSRI